MTVTPVTRSEEVAHLMKLYGGNAAQILARIDGQISILATRAQTMLSLAGITITVTGFSGTTIAKSGPWAARLLVMGLVIVLVSAAFTMWGILRVKWTTSMRPCEVEEAIHYALQRRDEKTSVYSRALLLLIVGLALYVSSVAFLIFPR
jgi:hypothetical protein